MNFFFSKVVALLAARFDRLIRGIKPVTSRPEQTGQDGSIRSLQRAAAQPETFIFSRHRPDGCDGDGETLAELRAVLHGGRPANCRAV